MSKKWQPQKKAASMEPSILIQRKCSCGGSLNSDGMCTECGKKQSNLQRSATNQTDSSTAPPIVQDMLQSSGQTLDPATRASMESHFDHDFSNVQVHADAKAAESAQAVNAQAFTVGRDVVFGPGQYTPQTSEGKRLLAHELTHVVQQERGTAAPSPLQNSSMEQAADQAATTLAQRSGPIQVSGASAPGLARQSQPKSLNQSLNPALLSDIQLEQEISLIREWLLNNPANSPERNQLLASLKALEQEVMRRGTKPATPAKTTGKRKGPRSATPAKSTEETDFAERFASRHHLLEQHLTLKAPMPKVDLTLHWLPGTPPPPWVTVTGSPEPEQKKEGPEKPGFSAQGGVGSQVTAGAPSQSFTYVQVTGQASNVFTHSFKHLPAWLSEWMSSIDFLGEPGFTLQFHVQGDAPGSVDAQTLLKLVQAGFHGVAGTTNVSLLVGGTVNDIAKGQQKLSERAAPVAGVEAESDVGSLGPIKVTIALDGLAAYQYQPASMKRTIVGQFSGELRFTLDF